ncbi:FAD-binding oxidoreductase [Granulosicoccus sp.]|nr:FAD-binding oxidoreductase [Granulosicoccus sp.]MDB4224711.1 FAD-binding oxidoreductase [Granulosicoccus sp.]
MSNRYKSWGYTPDVQQAAIVPAWQSQVSFDEGHSYLPFGNGLSYGDSCLNSSGVVLDGQYQNHIIDFDTEAGTITCESGVTFAELIDVCVRRGWFLPVSPGTRFVTVGGAIANDVHGKNHHKRGTFGCHVIEMEILRTDGGCTYCSPTENTELFNATIGGLGLTGFVSWAKFSLIPVKSGLMSVETLPFRSLDEFYEISCAKKDAFEYSVAWLDCAASGDSFGRGIFYGANHGETQSTDLDQFKLAKPGLSIPCNFPSSLLSPIFVKTFNAVYFQKHRRAARHSTASMGSYFYPLDNLRNWNRIYGRRGFFQYQFVVPLDGQQHLKSILEIIISSRSASFLAVLKEFGSVPSPGFLSFPKPGYCLALDFPNKGKITEKLIASLDLIVREAGGSVYPAKDRLMSAESFKQYYPMHRDFSNMIDPGMSSDFWRLVSS